jgi:hypothetical protein
MPQVYCRPCDEWFLIAPNCEAVNKRTDDQGVHCRVDSSCPECGRIWTVFVQEGLADELALLLRDHHAPQDMSLHRRFVEVLRQGGL